MGAVGAIALAAFNRTLTWPLLYQGMATTMRITAMVVYILFLVTPIRRLAGVRRRSSVTQRRGRLDYLSIGLETSLVSYMVTSFFLSVAYLWYAYYLVGYAIVLHRLIEHEEFSSKESISQTTSGALLGSPGTQLVTRESSW